VKYVDMNLENQVVRILGSATMKDLTTALAESGRNARLIGQGLSEGESLLVFLESWDVVPKICLICGWRLYFQCV